MNKKAENAKYYITLLNASVTSAYHLLSEIKKLIQGAHKTALRLAQLAKKKNPSAS